MMPKVSHKTNLQQRSLTGPVQSNSSPSVLMPYLQLCLHLTKSSALFLWWRRTVVLLICRVVCQLYVRVGIQNSSCLFCLHILASAANMTADMAVPGGNSGRGAGHVLVPHTTHHLVDNEHLTAANLCIKSKCAFAEKL